MGLNAQMAENSMIKKEISHPWSGEPTRRLSITWSVCLPFILWSSIDSTPQLIKYTYLLHYSTGQWYNIGGFPNSAHFYTAWVATIPNASSMHKHHIYGMISASRTTYYDTDTKTTYSTPYSSTPTLQNFRDPSTSNPTNTTLTPPNTSNTNTAPPSNPPAAIHHYKPTPLFRPTSTVCWGLVEAIVRHVKQTTDSTGHPSFSYQLLLPSGITRIIEETCLETYAPTAPPSHSTNPTPSPPVHVPYFAPSTVLTSLPPPLARLQLPVLQLPHPTFKPHPRLPPQPLNPLRPPIPS